MNAKTVAIEHSFSIYKEDCLDGIDNYIKDNLERLTTSSVWYGSDRQAIDMYATELNRKYNIDLDKSSLRYTNQYCWKVNSEKGDRYDC